MDLYSVRQQLNLGIPLTKIKLRVTDYSRVSTDHIEQKSSLKHQQEHFDDMIKNNPYWTYVKGYVDDGITGTSDIKRDNFMQMINDAKNDKFDLIITKEISRFSRNTLDSIKYTRELLNYGVAVFFINDNINTALPDAELRLTIMASMAQDEIRRLSERVKFGMNQSIKNGHILGNNLLYGYKKDKNTGSLLIIEHEAEIVRRLFRMYAIEEKSLPKIAKIFNAENIKTSLHRKWCTSTLTRMIKNPKYKGYYCGKKSEIIDYMTKKVKKIPEKLWITYKAKERIPPIVSEELWEKANTRLSSRIINKSKEIYKNRYPLSAKIYCQEHNSIYHRRYQHNNSSEITWSCAKFLQEGKKVCDSPHLRESEIYNIFKDIINKLSINLQEVINILTTLYKKTKIDKDISIKIIKYQKEKKKIILKKDKLLELNIEGYLSNREFKEKNNELNKELNKINNTISQLKKRNKYQNNIPKNNLYKKINDSINSSITFNKIISLLFNKIIVRKINNEKNNLELDIFLNISSKYLENELHLKSNPSHLFLTSNYEFKRGYTTTGTKRYIMKYKINCYYLY